MRLLSAGLIPTTGISYSKGAKTALSKHPAQAVSERRGVGDRHRMARADQPCVPRRAAGRQVGPVLEAAGCGLDRIVKVSIYLTDMKNFPKVVELRERWFTHPYPADTIVEVSSLALPELQIEIEAVALAP